MRSNLGARGRGRAGAPPRPASRAPHASTARIDSSELRNPSAIYTQAEILAQAQQTQVPSNGVGRLGLQRGAPPSVASSGGSTYGGSQPTGSLSSQTLTRLNDIAPFASGSSSSLYRTVLKTPMLTQLYMHGSFSSNAPDVLRQFTAELRFFQTVRRHRNIVAFVGSLEGVGMLLEYVDGDTLWKHLGKGQPMSVRADWFNQVLAGVTHIHSFGLGHNDLCSLNVVVTVPMTVSQARQSTRSPKYVVKLLDFGRSTSEPRPAPVPSALAALKIAQNNAMHQRHGVSHDEQERKRKEREKDLIFPGTRPFAAPEIMRAWTLSDAGGASTAKGDSEEEEEDEEDDEDDDLYSEPAEVAMDEDRSFIPSHPIVPPAPLPLPLSTPAYARDDDVVQQQHQAMNTLHIGRSPLRSRMPILSFSDANSSTASTSALPVVVPSSHPTHSRFHHPIPVPEAGPSGAMDAYPSPTSSPSHSQPSSPHEHPFAHDDAADVIHSEYEPSSHRRRERRSRSRNRFDGLNIQSPRPSSRAPRKSRAEARARRKARDKHEIETLNAEDPHPPSTILGDTYSLGVIALCLERDVLVDITPSVQMREKWRPLDPESRHAVLLPESQGGIAFFDGRFATKSLSSTTSRWNTPTGSLVERYMRPVRQREKCSKDDTLDIDAIRELERERGLRYGFSLANSTVGDSVPVSARQSGRNDSFDFLMDHGD